MKTIKFIIPICIALCGLTANAQLKLNADGNVIIGTATTSNATDSVSSLKIQPTDNGRMAAISFGNGSDAYIGKTADKDIVKIYGNDGFNLSSRNHINVMTYHDSTNIVVFSGDVTVSGVFTEFGTPVVADSLVIDLPINPGFPGGSGFNALDAISEMTVSTFDASTANVASTSAVGEYGININVMREMFPDLVITSADGKVYVDYMRMIPLLISAISELKAQIDTPISSGPILSPMNDDLETASTNTLGIDVVTPKLYQNAPNPFNSVTTIKYALPEDVDNAMLYVYDLQGTQKLAIEITERGENSVNITASKLPAGMYIYTLIADGKEIDTKRMILTK